MRSFWQPLASRRYRIIVAANVVSVTGSGAILTGLLVYLAFGYGARGTAAYLLTTAIAGLATASFAGVVADRVDRRVVVTAADLACALISMALALTVRRGLEWILVFAALRSAAGAFTSSANAAALAIIVRDGDPVRGFALNQAASNIARIAGMGLGGYLATGHHFQAACYLDAASFLIAAGLRWQLGAIPAPAGQAPGQQGPSRLLADLRAGLAHLRGSPRLRHIVLLLAVSTLAEQSVSVLVTILVVRVLHAPAWWLALIEGASVGVMIFGAPLTARVIHHLGPARSFALGCALAAGSIACLGLIPAVGFAVPVDLIWGVAASLASTAAPVLISMETPDQLRGRTEANLTSTLQAAGLVSLFLVGAINAAVGIRATFVLCAAPVLLAALAIALPGRRRDVVAAP